MHHAHIYRRRLRRQQAGGQWRQLTREKEEPLLPFPLSFFPRNVVCSVNNRMIRRPKLPCRNGASGARGALPRCKKVGGNETKERCTRAFPFPPLFPFGHLPFYRRSKNVRLLQMNYTRIAVRLRPLLCFLATPWERVWL